jgi:hypothetical protein
MAAGSRNTRPFVSAHNVLEQKVARNSSCTSAKLTMIDRCLGLADSHKVLLDTFSSTKGWYKMIL